MIGNESKENGRWKVIYLASENELLKKVFEDIERYAQRIYG
jgi:hypothetical protein